MRGRKSIKLNRTLVVLTQTECAKCQHVKSGRDGVNKKHNYKYSCNAAPIKEWRIFEKNMHYNLQTKKRKL